NPCRAFHDCIEHGLHIRRRAADDAQYFGCRGLMLQGLSQFCIALLDLLEQPHVLDRDDSLVGESFEESDLFFAKRTNLHTANVNRSDHKSFAKQWCDQNSSDVA